MALQLMAAGRAVGRYWSIGPQRSLYIPDSWWQARNRLVVFDEHGNTPEGAYLVRDERVAAHSVLA